MHQTLSDLFQKVPYLYLLTGAAALLLGMVARMAARNSNKAAMKTKQEQTKTHLAEKAAELLGITAASPLADRKQLIQRLERFRMQAIDRGMKPDDFIPLAKQTKMREIAFATRNEFELGGEQHAPHEPILAIFAPTPTEHTEIACAAELEQEGDITEFCLHESLPTEISDTDIGDNDHATFVDENSDTGIFERNKLVLNTESRQILFFPEDDTDLAATRVDC